MQLLDVISPGQPYRPHKHLIGIVKEAEPVNAVDTITNNTVPTDSLTPDTLATDTVNTLQGMVNGAGTGGDDSSMLLWTAFVVLGALALCFYFAYTYRRRLGTVRS